MVVAVRVAGKCGGGSWWSGGGKVGSRWSGRDGVAYRKWVVVVVVVVVAVVVIVIVIVIVSVIVIVILIVIVIVIVMIL